MKKVCIIAQHAPFMQNDSYIKIMHEFFSHLQYTVNVSGLKILGNTDVSSVSTLYHLTIRECILVHQNVDYPLIYCRLDKLYNIPVLTYSRINVFTILHYYRHTSNRCLPDLLISVQSALSIRISSYSTPATANNIRVTSALARALKYVSLYEVIIIVELTFHPKC